MLCLFYCPIFPPFPPAVVAFSIVDARRVQQFICLYFVLTHAIIALHCKVAKAPLSREVEPWTLLLVG